MNRSLRLLVIGLDPTVMDPSSVSAQRQVTYYTGYETDIVVLASGNEATVEVTSGMRVHRPGGKGVRQYWNAFRLIRRLRREKGEYDVVTVQEPAVCGLLAWISRASHRIHVQDHSAMFDRPASSILDFVRRGISRGVMHAAARIRTVSERGKRGLLSIGIPEEKIDVVPIAVDLSSISLRESSVSGHRLLTVARLFSEKGVDVLLHALAIVRKTYPDVSLTIVGDGPERASLESLMREQGLDSLVHFVGAKTDVRPYLAEANVYVQPSRFEGWGMAVVEAAAAGVPIVMTDVGLAGEVIRNQENGRVVPPENPTAFAQAICEAFEHPEQSLRMATEARHALERLPSPEETRQRNRQSLESASTTVMRFSPVLRLFLVAVAIRFLLFLVIRIFVGEVGFERGDTAAYLGVARSLLAGEGFAFEGAPYYYRTGGFPLIVAAVLGIFRSTTVFVFLQLILASTIPLLVLRLGRRLNLGTRAIWIAAWMAVVEPHLVYYSVMILTETVSTVFYLLAFLWTFDSIERKRVRTSVYAGIAFGAGMLIKPLLQLFPLMLLIGVLPWWRRIPWKVTLKHAFIICGTVFMIVLPWMLRNLSTFGSFSLSSQGSAVALYYLGTSIVSMRDHVTYQEAERRVRVEFKETYGSFSTEAEESPFYTRAALKYILDEPGLFVRLLAVNTVTLWTSSNYNSFLNYYKLTPPIDHSVLPPTHYLAQGRIGDLIGSLWKIFSQPFYLVGLLGRLVWIAITIFFIAGVIAAYRRIPERRLHLMVLLSFCAYLTAIVWLDGLGIEARLRFSVMPIEFLYAGYGWVVFRRRKKKMGRRLLILTQRVDANDPNLAVHVRWLSAFSGMRDSVTVIAQSVGMYELPSNVRVFSLGKESSHSKLRQALRLAKLLFREVPRSDSILVLMVPLYVIAAAPIAFFSRVPLFLWYTHKRVSLTLRVATWCVQKIFSASPESFRLSTKKVRFLGHAIETDFFVPAVSEHRIPEQLVSVGRIAPVKRVDLLIDAVHQLHASGVRVRLDFFGVAVVETDIAYEASLRTQVLRLGLGEYVRFRGAASPQDVRTAYQTAAMCLNASETGSLDKAVLEAMACGCPVVTSNEAFRSLVPEGFVVSSGGEAFAKKIQEQLRAPLASNFLRARVVEGHTLSRTLATLVSEMDEPSS